MKTAMQFGAGNIGRGFMGQLFWEAGYKTYFIENNTNLVRMLNNEGEYPLRLLDAYSKQEIDLTINNIEAVATKDTERAAELLAGADIAGTAVGERNLQAVAPLIAAGIRKRMSGSGGQLDIYMCENMYGAGETLKKYVFELMSAEEKNWAENNIGFVSTSVARMVPAPDKRFEAEGPLFVVADSYHELPYDGTARRASEPPIKGMKAVSNFKAEVERKLYTHNLGHAAMGYIGYLRGYTYVHEPFNDDKLSKIFEGALDETSQALVKMYPDDITPEEQEEVRKDVRVRFGNPMLMDTLTRVARDPMRKLGPNDRLIGSAKLCMQYDIFPENIAFVCGAAYRFDYPEDPAAVELQKLIREKGIEEVLKQISEVDPSGEFGKKVIESFNSLKSGKGETKI